MTEWKSGQVILGEYTIEKELGRGGMGRVWLVKSNSTARRFAVKQTLLKEDKHRKAFLAELQTWIDLPEHPNIVPCRFFRTVGDDVLIFSEFVDGGSLKNWIDSRRLYEGDQRQSLKRILETAIQFAWGLHSIHELGLVHQDVKPGNVLMSSGAEAALQGMRVQVSDYGLARARARSGAQGIQAAGEGSILLSSGGYTPAYCSPEQAKGLPITRKTDQWSWGVSVLEMFTGGVTWHSGHLAGAVLDQYVEDADESSGIPVMPLALAEILRKCFQNDPAKRWANLGEVVARLKTAYSTITGEDYDRELIQIVHRDTPQAGLAERRSAHGGEWADPRMWLEKALRLSGRNPAEASEITERQGRSRRGQLVSDLAIFEEAKSIFLDMVKKGRRDLEPDIARLCMNKAPVHRAADDISGTIAEYDQAIAVRRRLVEREWRWDIAADLAVSLTCKGAAVAAVGQWEATFESYDQSIAIWRQLVEQDGRKELSENMARTLLNKANALAECGDLRAAIPIYDESIALRRQLVEQDGHDELTQYLATTLMSKANALKSLNDPRGAIVLYDESVRILRRLVDEAVRHDLAPDLAMALVNLATSCYLLDEYNRAQPLFDESIVIWRRLVDQEGRNDFAEHLAMALMNKANVLLVLGDMGSAVVLYEDSIAIRRRLVEQDGRNDLRNALAMALMNKAVAVQSMGDVRGSLALFDEVIDIRRHLVEEEDRSEMADSLAKTLINKADALQSLGDYRGAAVLCDESVALLRRLVEQGGRHELANSLARAVQTKTAVMDALRRKGTV